VSDGEILIAVQGENFVYGNNIKSGEVSDTPRLSRIDVAHSLPFGLLTNFYVYVAPSAGLETILRRQIQLQIWRLVNKFASNYRLVWQRLAFVNTSSTTGALLTVST